MMMGFGVKFLYFAGGGGSLGDGNLAEQWATHGERL